MIIDVNFQENDCKINAILCEPAKVIKPRFTENEEAIYKAGYSEGQSSMVDPEKVIEKTATGEGTLALDDVSEIPHDVEVQLDSNLLEMGEDKILFQSGTFVSITETSLSCKGNSGMSSHILFKKKYGAGTYTLSCGFEGGEKNRFLIRCYDANGNIITNAFSNYIAWYQANIFDLQKVKITIPNTVAYWVWGWCPVGVLGELITITNPKIEVGDGLTSYEGISLSVNGDVYSSPSNGLISGIKSYSPNMTFTTDEGIKIEARYHKSFGMQTEYDRFWDAFQENGNRTDYGGAFYGIGWTPETFKPKYDIVPTTAANLFRGTKNSMQGLDLVERLEELGIVLDVSKITGTMSSTFQYCGFSRIGVVDTRGSSKFSYTFAELDGYNRTIEKIILKDDGSQTYEGMFAYSSTVVNVTFEGVIGQNGFNMQWAHKLSKASITSIINALSTTTSGLTVTLSKTAVTSAFGSTTADEWLNLIATKNNWTISLV